MIEGLYVTRIKVKPTESWTTYYWMSDLGKPVIPEKKEENVFVPMEGRKYRKLMKEKFELNFVPDEIDPEEKEELLFWVPRANCFHEGGCQKPDPGLPLSNKKPSSL